MSAFHWIDDDKLEAQVAAVNAAQRDASWWHGRLANWAADYVGEMPPKRIPPYLVEGLPSPPPPMWLSPAGIFRVVRDSLDGGLSGGWVSIAEANFRVWLLDDEGKIAEILPDVDRRFNLSAAEVRAAREEIKAIEALKKAAEARLEKMANEFAG